MSAALGSGDQVDVAFLNAVTALGQPQQGPVDGFLVTGQAAAEWLIGQAFKFADGIDQIRTQAVFVMPLDLFVGVFVFERDQQPRAQHSLGLEHVLKAADGKLG